MSGCCSRLPLWVVAALLLFFVCLLIPPSDGVCKVEQCSRQYARATLLDDVPQGSSYRYCTILQSYAACVRATARHCRGELDYHTTSRLIEQYLVNFKCENILAGGPPQEPSAPPVAVASSSSEDDEQLSPECMYSPVASMQGEQKLSKFPYTLKKGGASPSAPAYSHCGLFGDPHLRTFNNELQTCRVKGAWPLIDNPYLAVQVTSVPVHTGSRATAISKITVIVRRHGPCTATDKMYEAQRDSLPGVFVDGTTGNDRAVRLKEIEPGRHVEIHLRHISTLLILRRVGHYLTFAARMPSDIALHRYPSATRGETSLELCYRGCPKQELIEFKQLYAYPKLWAKVQGKEVALGMNEALVRCQKLDATGFYFDACVFDLLTTGDINFSQTAYLAKQDMLTLNSPMVNRTSQSPSSLPHHLDTRQSLEKIENHGPGRPSFNFFFVILLLVLLRYI